MHAKTCLLKQFTGKAY